MNPLLADKLLSILIEDSLELHGVSISEEELSTLISFAKETSNEIVAFKENDQLAYKTDYSISMKSKELITESTSLPKKNYREITIPTRIRNISRIIRECSDAESAAIILEMPYERVSSHTLSRRSPSYENLLTGVYRSIQPLLKFTGSVTEISESKFTKLTESETIEELSLSVLREFLNEK